MYAAAQEVDFEQQLWDASKVVFQQTSSVDWETLFFLRADGKAQILVANCKNFKAEASQAMVCWVCGRNRADCLANFGLEATIDGWWEVVLPMGAIYRPSQTWHSRLRVARAAVGNYFWYFRHEGCGVGCHWQFHGGRCPQFFPTDPRCCSHGSQDGNKG